MDTSPYKYEEKIQKKIQSIDKIIVYSERFLPRIHTTVEKKDPELLDQYKQNINNLKKCREKINTVLQSDYDLLEMYSDIYIALNLILNSANIICSISCKIQYIEPLVQWKSESFTETIFGERDDIITSINELQAENAKEDFDIFNAIVAKYDLESNLSKTLLFINKYRDKVNKFLTYIIRIVLQSEKTTANNRLKLLEIVENQKDIVLGSERKLIKDIPAIQQMTVGFHFIPASEFMDGEKIFKEITTQNYDISKPFVENIKKIKDAGIVFIRKKSTSPYEFIIWGLTSQNYIEQNKLFTTLTGGLNHKYIKRFSTILSQEVNEELDDGIEIYNVQPETNYVIETFNGYTFRLMGRKGNKVSLESDIVGFTKGLSNRASRYNEEMTDEIIPNCFDERLTNIVRDYETAPKVSTLQIKDEVIMKLPEAYKQFIEKYPVKNTDEFKKSHNDSWDKTIQSLLFDIFRSNISNIKMQKSREYFVSITPKLYGMTKKYKKEFDIIINTMNISDIHFKEYSKHNLKEFLSSYYKKATIETVKQLEKQKQWEKYERSLKEYFLEELSILL